MGFPLPGVSGTAHFTPQPAQPAATYPFYPPAGAYPQLAENNKEIMNQHQRIANEIQKTVQTCIQTVQEYVQTLNNLIDEEMQLLNPLAASTSPQLLNPLVALHTASSVAQQQQQTMNQAATNYYMPPPTTTGMYPYYPPMTAFYPPRPPVPAGYQANYYQQGMNNKSSNNVKKEPVWSNPEGVDNNQKSSRAAGNAENPYITIPNRKDGSLGTNSSSSNNSTKSSSGTTGTTGSSSASRPSPPQLSSNAMNYFPYLTTATPPNAMPGGYPFAIPMVPSTAGVAAPVGSGIPYYPSQYLPTTSTTNSTTNFPSSTNNNVGICSSCNCLSIQSIRFNAIEELKKEKYQELLSNYSNYSFFHQIFLEKDYKFAYQFLYYPEDYKIPFLNDLLNRFKKQD